MDMEDKVEDLKVEDLGVEDSEVEDLEVVMVGEYLLHRNYLFQFRLKIYKNCI